ncbi:hypothetical protein DMENIID0001_144610 [Sergentomyia squamirostris]
MELVEEREDLPPIEVNQEAQFQLEPSMRQLWNTTIANTSCNNLKLRIQPQIVAVGSPDSIGKIYVYYNTLQYKLPTIKKAIDMVVKICFIHNMEYSAITKNVWHFIQLYFYGIPSSNTVVSSVVTNLINKINRTTK